MIIRCPACGFTGRVPEDKNARDRKRVVCPSCGHRFVVGLTVLPPDGGPAGSPPPPSRTGGTINDTQDRTSAEIGAGKLPGQAGKKRRHPVLWGCLIVLAALAIGVTGYILIHGISGRLQESKEYDIIKKLGEKHPGYLLLYSITNDPGSMTELQITSYERGLVGKGCVGMGTVVDIQKTIGSSVMDFFGLTSPGTIISLTYEGYNIDLVLEKSYSDEFLAYNIGDTVLFAGTIKKAAIGKGMHLTLVKVVIEGHQKGEAGRRPPETKKSLSSRIIELLLK